MSPITLSYISNKVSCVTQQFRDSFHTSIIVDNNRTDTCAFRGAPYHRPSQPILYDRILGKRVEIPGSDRLETTGFCQCPDWSSRLPRVPVSWGLPMLSRHSDEKNLSEKVVPR
jgi:hypothetical protein